MGYYDFLMGDYLKLNQVEADRMSAWVPEVNKRAAAKQIADGRRKDSLMGPTEDHPATGAIGGNISISFTLTSVGPIIILRESITGEELDITDYNNW